MEDEEGHVGPAEPAGNDEREKVVLLEWGLRQFWPAFPLYYLEKARQDLAVREISFLYGEMGVAPLGWAPVMLP
jgi:hypothetical protein